MDGSRVLVDWLTDEGEMHSAERSLGLRGTLHMQVESLGECGWDWHVWERSGRGQQRYGLADTLDEAKAKAEGALGGLTRELSLAA